jgi:glycine cleavage system P protein (glycine dehydrogenase) subunit 1
LPFIPHTDNQRREMLAVVGARSLDELFAHIPDDLRLKRELDLPPALSEAELERHAAALSAKNSDPASTLCFIGAGAYDHLTPAAVAPLVGRPEFYTAYTPYQPEVSQGILQSIFEYQTMIARLCGLDVANASLYEGATATYEAALLAVRATRRTRIVVDGALNPRYLALLRAYASNMDMQIEEVAPLKGASDLEGLAARADKTLAGVIVQNPNFFGLISDTSSLASKLHESRSLLISVGNPVAMALLKPPGQQGADIVCGEAQCLGLPLNGGGPYLGFIAATTKLARKLPGRLVGQTTDGQGRRGYVLTLQAREQHIRREKATSNICSNQALCALQAAIHVALLGNQGLKEVAGQCLAKTAYAREKLSALPGCNLPFEGPCFHEFVLELPGNAEEVYSALLQKGIAAGLPLSRHFPEMTKHLLVCVTEKRTRAEIDLLVSSLAAELEG